MDTVAFIANLSDTAGQAALQILLILTGQGQQEESSYPHELKEAISLLNPLPTVPILADLRVSLETRQRNRNISMSKVHINCMGRH